eukprot:5039593-Prymnesium_polylepis.1
MTEPISPPIAKPLTTIDHCIRLTTAPRRASERGATSSRLFSTPVANPDWSDEPMAVTATAITSRVTRYGDGDGASSPRKGWRRSADMRDWSEAARQTLVVV